MIWLHMAMRMRCAQEVCHDTSQSNVSLTLNEQLAPLEMVSVATDQLGEKVVSLADEGLKISDALDELLTRSWS